MFTIYKDISSIAFIRCTAKIEGSPFCAEGTGFTINTAVEKCRSELMEANFQVRNKIKALGIAAHRDPAKSENHAYLEALETVMLQKIASNQAMHGIPIIFSSNLKIVCAKVNGFWFSLLIGKQDDCFVYTYSVRKSLIGSILHSWSEYRNIKFYKVKKALLKNYTKGNKLFQGFVPAIILSSKQQIIITSDLKKLVHQEGNHVVTYFTTGENT